jgi:chromosome segregation ATPase
MNDQEKIIRSILKQSSDRTKPVKKIFKFNLLKLITKQTEEQQTKIKNAIDNEKRWSDDCIQKIAMNSLQDLFFNVIDNVKVEKFTPGEYYIAEKHLETILNEYFETKKELEEEIDTLREDSIPIKEHDKEIKSLKQEFKRDEEDYKRRIQKLEDTEKFLREKIEKSEPRIKEQLMTQLKADGWQKVTEEIAYN